MKGMFIAEMTLVAVSVVSFVAAVVISCVHCDSGFLGYEDKWDSEAAEKLYYRLMPVSVVCIALFVIVRVVEYLIVS